MPNRLKYEAVATVGEYQDKSGNTKKRYQRVGVVFENDEGHLSLKMDAVPVGPDWSGWVNFYEPKQRGASPQAPVTRHPDGSTSPFHGDAEENDDIPF